MFIVSELAPNRRRSYAFGRYQKALKRYLANIDNFGGFPIYVKHGTFEGKELQWACANSESEREDLFKNIEKAGHVIHEHQSRREITLHFLRGWARCSGSGMTVTMPGGI